jgi:hypothetical protein
MVATNGFGKQGSRLQKEIIKRLKSRITPCPLFGADVKLTGDSSGMCFKRQKVS